MKYHKIYNREMVIQDIKYIVKMPPINEKNTIEY